MTTTPDNITEAVEADFLDVKATITRSAGEDGAIVVFIDTLFEPDGSDGGPGLRIILNDSDTYVGLPYGPNSHD